MTLAVWGRGGDEEEPKLLRNTYHLGPKNGEQSKWLWDPCHLGHPKVGIKVASLTPAILGLPKAGRCQMAT